MSSRSGMQGNQRLNAVGPEFLSRELFMSDQVSVKTRLVRWFFVLHDGNVLM